MAIPLISNEPINIGEKRLFEHELAEFFHERPQSRLLHGWNELIIHAALTEQGMCSPLGGAGFEMFVESESFASGAEQRQKSRRQSIEQLSVIFLFDVLCFPLFDGPIGEFRKSAPDATQHAVVLAAVKDAARR